MPLSDHEQRLLDQIERALYADDPKFAASVRATDLRHHYRLRAIRSGVALAAGTAALIVGTITLRWYVTGVGFVLMLLAALRGFPAVSRLVGRPFPGWRPARPRPMRRRRGVRARLEERWERRFGDHDLH